MPSADPCRNDGQSHLVGCPESVKKGCADTLSIGRSCGLDHMPAGVRELSEKPASIVGGCSPGDVPEPLKALDEACAPAAAEQYPFGKLCHAHSLVGRVVEEDQHLTLRQRQAVCCPHLEVQLAEHVRVDLKKPLPSREFPWGECIAGGQRNVSVSAHWRLAGCRCRRIEPSEASVFLESVRPARAGFIANVPTPRRRPAAVPA